MKVKIFLFMIFLAGIPMYGSEEALSASSEHEERPLTEDQKKEILERAAKILKNPNPKKAVYNALQKEFVKALNDAVEAKAPLFPVWLNFMQSGVLDRGSIDLKVVRELLKIGSVKSKETGNQIFVLFDMPPLPKISEANPVIFNDIQFGPTRMWRLKMEFNEDEILQDQALDTVLISSPNLK